MIMRLYLVVAAWGFLAMSAADRPPALTVPLCPGLTIVTAVAQPQGDYESIKTIESSGPREVRLKYSAEINGADALSGPPKLIKMLLRRTMLSADLESASFYQQTFLEKSAEMAPGTTAIGTSAAILRALKAKGEADMSISNAYAGLELSGDKNKFPSYYNYQQSGKIKRVASTHLKVIVNDQLVELPAIRAQGDFVGDKAEFFFLDDERNPLTLSMGGG